MARKIRHCTAFFSDFIFARVEDVRKTVTPQLRTDKGASRLLLIDLGERKIA